MEWRLLLMSFGAFSNVESGFIVAFYALRRRSLAPDQMAIFTRKDFHARMVEMYFSPAASHLGAMAGAAPAAAQQDCQACRSLLGRRTHGR